MADLSVGARRRAPRFAVLCVSMSEIVMFFDDTKKREVKTRQAMPLGRTL